MTYSHIFSDDTQVNDSGGFCASGLVANPRLAEDEALTAIRQLTVTNRRTVFHLGRVCGQQATLVRDAEPLERTLASEGDEVVVSLSRESAEMMVRLVQAQAKGQEIVLTHGLQEVSPADAASPRYLGLWTPCHHRLVMMMVMMW